VRHIVVVTSFLLTLFLSLAPRHIKSREAIDEELYVLERQHTLLTAAAKKAALEFGIQPAKSHLKLRTKNNLVKADFWPKQEEGMIIYGGGLTVYLAKDGTIVSAQISP
jgi:hypothetical protein